jgi:hypothetical protein
MDRMAETNLDVLQNIEFVIVETDKSLDGLDDLRVNQAIKAAIDGRRPEDPLAQQVADAICAERELRPDVTDNVFREALAVVKQSVGNHSSLRPGERGYLDFVCKFIR